jgi:hypothetical protein
MHRFPFHLAALVFLFVLALGCSNSGKSTDSHDAAAPANAAANPAGKIEGVVKIAVLTDGTVLVNSEPVAIDSLAAKLDSSGEIKEFWYHREGPEDADPHENAMKVVEEMAKRRLPIAFYLDRGFTQRAKFGD